MSFDVKINVDVNATLETIKFNGTADSIKFKYYRGNEMKETTVKLTDKIQ